MQRSKQQAVHLIDRVSDTCHCHRVVPSVQILVADNDEIQEQKTKPYPPSFASSSGLAKRTSHLGNSRDCLGQRSTSGARGCDTHIAAVAITERASTDFGCKLLKSSGFGK